MLFKLLIANFFIYNIIRVLLYKLLKLPMRKILLTTKITIISLLIYFLLSSNSAFASLIISDSFSGGYDHSLWHVRTGYLDPISSDFGLTDNSAANWYILDSSTSSLPNNSVVKFDAKINSLVSDVIFSCKTDFTNDLNFFNDNDLRVFLHSNGTAKFDSFITGGGATPGLFNWNSASGTHTFELTCTNGNMNLKEDGVTLSTWNSNRDFALSENVYFGYRNGNTEFANYKLCDNSDCVTLPTPTQTPTPTSTPTPTATPTPTPYPTIGPFELPIGYTDRGNNAPTQFKIAFWNRLTAAFDHVFAPGTFRPFTGNTYKLSDCPAKTVGIFCYDSHNGTDFSQVGGQDVYSVASGTVTFTSGHDTTTCTPNKGGFGCVVIINYSNGTYGLFAHLDKIFVQTNETVYPTSVIGEMGKTGCPKCGEHLHFGVLKSLNSPLLIKTMSRANWQELLYQIKPLSAPIYKPYCSYVAPNGAMFNFQDPSGWTGGGDDPWSLSKANGGCDTPSTYLWKYDIGTTP